MRTTLRVNGQDFEVDCAGLTSLSDVLRAQLGLVGTKVACGRGECGSCTVLVGGVPQMSCVLPAAVVVGDVETIEGIAEEIADLRAEFADRGAFQCGFCTPGQLVHGAAVIHSVNSAVEGRLEGDELTEYVRRQISGNICRCTGYQAIVASICEVARSRRADGADRSAPPGREDRP